MSYILDALRKSDQQRQRGVPPALLAPQATEVVPKRRVSMSHVLLAVILMGAGIVIGALRPWQTEQRAPTTGPAAMQPIESSPSPSPLPVPARPQMAPESEQNPPSRNTASAALQAPSPAAPAQEPQVSAVAKPVPLAKTLNTPRDAVAAVPRETAKPVPGKPDGARPGDAAQEPKMVAIAELPLSIQQEIPTMSISVHAYSGTPKDRLVGINDRILREGEYVAPGLMLEQITLDGLILSYKGYRFRRGVR